MPFSDTAILIPPLRTGKARLGFRNGMFLMTTTRRSAILARYRCSVKAEIDGLGVR